MKVYDKEHSGERIRFFLKYPIIETICEDLFSGGRVGKRFDANTGFLYFKQNEERPMWFELTILGFGIAIAKGNDDFDLKVEISE